MIFALLRGLFLGALASVVGFLFVEGIILASPLPRMESDDALFLVQIPWVIGAAALGYATHPLAKRLPKGVEKRITALASRYGTRFLVGLAVGMFSAWLLWVIGAAACGLLPMLETKIELPPRVHKPEFLPVFTAIAVIAATFAGGMVGGVLAPPESEGNQGRPLTKVAVSSAIGGAIAGAWIGAGAGLALLNLAKWRRGYEPTEDMAAWLAIGAGLAAGVAAAIVLRMWRNR